MVFSIAAAVVALLGALIVMQWVRVRRRGHGVPPNGLSVAAVFLTTAASLYWAVDVLDGDNPTFAWVALILPVAIATIGIVPRRQIRWGAAILFVPFALLTGASVGVAYLPAALVMFMAASATRGAVRAEPHTEHRHITSRRTA